MLAITAKGNPGTIVYIVLNFPPAEIMVSRALGPNGKRILFCVVCSLAMASKAYGLSGIVGVFTGTMQQPTSNYFHFAYGAYLGVETESKGFQIQLGYMERPKFDSLGFEDQEAASFILVGTNLIDFGWHGFSGHGGFGKLLLLSGAAIKSAFEIIGRGG